MRPLISYGSTPLALENPPLLIVSDMARFRIRTNWTNSVSETHEFTLDDLADAATRNMLKWAMSEPERLRPGETRQTVTERAATTFAALAQALRERGHESHVVAHFVNRLVFCMFAEDVGLLPNNMFTRMLEHARQQPEEFSELAHDLFGAMSTGGRIGFEPVAWFNGGLFNDDTTLPLEQSRHRLPYSRRRHSTGRRLIPRFSVRCSSAGLTLTNARN